MSKSKTKYLIVDTTPFIRTVPLNEFGETVITITDVIEEIKNKRQYRSLFSLTNEVEIKPVFNESVAFVTEFSKKTGDYGSLSATDINLIALTYQMELEHVGDAHLRKSPVMQQFDPKILSKNRTKINSLNGLNLPIKLKNFVEKIQDLSINREGDEKEDDEEEEEEEDEDEEEDDDEYEDAEEEIIEEEEYDDDNEVESEDNTGGWITYNNLSHLRKNMMGNHVQDKEIIVGCMTSDFAIQNVLMQIGLNVVSLDGRLITELRAYVLRCYACFRIITNMTKIFCPKCGNRTLKRVSVYIDKDGNKFININFRKPISTRGKRFPLPMPKGGKHFVFPKLAADAKRPQQKASRLARTKTEAMTPDYIANLSPFATRDIYSRSAQHGFNRGKPVTKYWMRRNPNESKPNVKK